MAGLVVARRLARTGRHITLLESGSAAFVDAAQQLNRGSVVGDDYADLRTVRQRQIGGTVNTWNTPVHGRPGAKYVPLDSIDFIARGNGRLPGWPICYEELIPWYEQAQTVCRLGPFRYEGTEWQTQGTPSPIDLPESSPLTTRVYQFGPASVFTEEMPNELRSMANVTIAERATVISLSAERDRSRAHRVVYCLEEAGTEHSLAAGTVILAAGAIENARLLMHSGGPFAKSDVLGRYFMEHPRDYAMLLRPRSADLYSQLKFYDQNEAANGTMVMGRLALLDSCLNDQSLTNASITLLPQRRMTSKPVRMMREALRAMGLRREGDYPRGGAGWSHGEVANENFEYVRLLVNLEQAPCVDNRLRLDGPLDKLGVPAVALDWRWRDHDQAQLNKVRALVIDAFNASGLGSVEIDSAVGPDPNAHHHAGTTRMSLDPELGVVDTNCRVHGLDNVYVAGGSVFPTAGFANPSLTIVALALRLAEDLSAKG
jgi:choline dehydrogenase-like flavoprotein